MTGHTKGLSELLAKVQAASGPLDNRTALEIHVMGWGKLTDFTPVVDRDEYGGWALTYQVDAKGGGRQKCTMPEDRLPDRSIDAALALVERVLPGWQWTVNTDRSKTRFWSDMHRVVAKGDFETVWSGRAPTAPLAIISALLSALIAGSKP